MTTIGRPPRPVAERFWAKVAKSDGCWEWTAQREPNGYGAIRDGRPGTPKVGAHRVSWELANGPIPAGMFVLHRCDNRGCVRPDHLFLGTQADNIHDMWRKGRQSRFVPPPGPPGAKSPYARLTDEQARDIRDWHGVGVTVAALARFYGIGETTVRSVVKGRRYVEMSHV